MRYNHATRRELQPDQGTTELVELDTRLVPFILAGMLEREKRFYWTSDEAATAGRQALARQGAWLVMGIGNEIVNSVNRVYTLLDKSLNGRDWYANETGEAGALVEYSPLLPATPEGGEPQAQSIRHSALETYRAVDNGLHGRDHTGYEDTRNPRQQLEDLIAAAGSAGELDDEMLAKLAQIALAIA